MSSRTLTEREKMAITYAVVENITKAGEIYALAHDMSELSDNPLTAKNRANVWRRSVPVDSYFKRVEGILANRVDIAVKSQLKMAREDPSYTPTSGIDFTNLRLDAVQGGIARQEPRYPEILHPAPLPGVPFVHKRERAKIGPPSSRIISCLLEERQRRRVQLRCRPDDVVLRHER